MEDKLGFELQEGDLVMNVGNGGCYLCILHGGLTKSGNPRILSYNGYKGYAKAHNLLKATPEQFSACVDKAIASYNSSIERMQERVEAGEVEYQQSIDIYRQSIERYENLREDILQMNQEAIAQR